MAITIYLLISCSLLKGIHSLKAESIFCLNSLCYEFGECPEVPCHCGGNIRGDMCYELEATFSYNTLILASLFILLFAVERILAWRYHIYNFFRKTCGCFPCCHSLEPELHETIRASNPNTTKSPTFAITPLFFSPQDRATEDPDLDLAIEISQREADQRATGAIDGEPIPSTSGVTRSASINDRSISVSTISSDYHSVTTGNETPRRRSPTDIDRSSENRLPEITVL